MISLVAFLLIGRTPVSHIAPLPLAVPVSVGTPKQWSIQKLNRPPADPLEIEDTQKGKTVTIRGRKVRIAPTDGNENVDRVQKGSDASLLITRGHRQLIWTSQDSIWFQGKERPVAAGGVSVYLDRKNYAGSFVKDAGRPGMPQFPPQGYCVRNGRHFDLGYGSVRYWRPGGLAVLDVPVDEHLNPSGVEFTVGTVTRLVGSFGQAAFPGYQLLGVQKDGTVVLVSGAGDSQSSGGYMYLGKNAPDVTNVVHWKDGKVLDHFQLPKSWVTVGLSPTGWILARKLRPLKGNMPEIKPGTRAEDIVKAMNANDDTGEDDWTMGILSGKSITPVSFRRPAGTSKLLWRNGDEVYGPHALRIHVFYGNVDKWYRLAAS